MPLHRHEPHEPAGSLDIRPQYALIAEVSEVPRFRLGSAPLPRDVAYQIVHDELLLDGSARPNLATFVTTWMEPEGERLMAESAAKNLIDKDEYPRTAELERRCVSILADLWHASAAEAATGCSTTGSSEACMLAGLALKWRWRQRREAAGLSSARPNLVLGANAQVCWKKFCRYWDVEPRLVPVGPDTTHLTADGARAHCDGNTIGVVAVLGSTFDGSYEPVAERPFEGYRLVQQTCRDTARWLAAEIAGPGPFELVSAAEGIPAFALRLRPGAGYTVFDVSEHVRRDGWTLPAYRMPPSLDGVAVLRIVVRNGFSRDLGRDLVDDLRRVIEHLGANPGNGPEPRAGGFRH